MHTEILSKYSLWYIFPLLLFSAFISWYLYRKDEKFIDLENDFIGKEALIKQQTEGIERVLTGFICEGRRSARSHFKVISDGKEVGEVTSGSFSPCLKKGIGLCYIDKEIASGGTEVILKDGKIEIGATLKTPPFISR